MKKTSIIILVAIAVSIGVLISMSADFIARIDKTVPMEYDPAHNPNYLSFVAVDSLGGRTKVVYHNSKPAELDQSDRVVLKGRMQGNVFECSEILLKCPSKYKDDKKQLEKSVTDTKS
jgi:cytochrome c-type biogenesis protein CcmE